MGIRGFSSNLFGWQERNLRDGKPNDLETVLRGCAESGLDAVEVDPTTQVLKLLKFYDLKVSSAYVGLPLHDHYSALQVDEKVLPLASRLAEAGGTDLLINADPIGEWTNVQLKNEADIQRQGENLTRIAEKVSSLGIRISMHNHAANHPNSIGDLRSVTEYAAANVGLCVDTGWAHTSGCAPLAWIKAFPTRIYALHLRNQQGSVPTEDLLAGEIEMPQLIHALQEISYNGWLTLELWHPQETLVKRTMQEDVKLSIEYLKRHVK